MDKMKMFFGKRFFLTILCFGLIGLLQAQEQKEVLTLTLEKAIQVALDENPTIKAADKEITLKKIADKQAWQTLLPQVDITGRLDHTITAAQMNLGGQSFKMGKDNSNTANAIFAISLPVFVPGVYKTMSMTKADIELAVERSRASKLDLMNQVTKAYYQLILAQDSYRVLEASYKLAEDNFKVVSEKFSQGTVSEFDKISAEVQMRSIKPNVISADNAVKLAKLQLKVLMGVTADVDLDIKDQLDNYETSLFGEQLEASEHGLVNNTTMKQFDLNKKLLQKNLSLLKTNFMPTLSLSYSYQYQSLYNPNFNVFNYNWGNSSSIMLNVSIPLFKASNFTKVKSVRVQLDQLEYNRVDTERKLNMQVTTYRDNMKKSSEQVVSNRENVIQAKKAVEIAGKRYEVGKGTVLELNTSQVSLTQAQLAYNQSIYDYLVAKSDLDKLMGKE